jgi:O-acetyl-ADP-ribose deacetylase (regulator of RNase III)
MIHETAGDILLSRADLIAHGVSPDDDFKNGLARSLREAWPAMYKDFRHYCRQKSPRPGTIWLWQGVDPKGRHVRIAALFTQDAPAHEGGHPGRAKTEHVNHALHELKKLVETEKFGSLALPRLATGVGGLDWAHVEPLVRTQLGSVQAQVFVYTNYQKGVEGKEDAAGSAKRAKA